MRFSYLKAPSNKLLGDSTEILSLENNFLTVIIVSTMNIVQVQSKLFLEFWDDVMLALPARSHINNKDSGLEPWCCRVTLFRRLCRYFAFQNGPSHRVLGAGYPPRK
jgi:hypothetical protein